MTVRSNWWGLLLVGLVVGFASGCEPYLSMTDPMSAEARRAASLLPQHPNFVGMVDVETVFRRMEETGRLDLADSLQHSDHERLQAFFEATGFDLRDDLHAVYGAMDSNESLSAIVTGNLSPDQVRDYLDQSAEEAGRAGTYRDVPFFQLALGEGEAELESDTLSMAFLDKGLVAVALDAQRARSMVDRRQDQSASLADNEEYMQLMQRVSGGTTAWMMGRDVLKTALQDTAEAGTTATVNRAGVQKVLLDWSNRVLGLSEVPDVSKMGRGTEEKLERLRRRIREQAVSLTWEEGTVDGQIFLAMRDEASATSVVQVAEGALAALRLSSDNLTERQRTLLDEVTVERVGALVHVRFTVDQELLGPKVQAKTLERVVRRGEPSTRRAMASAHRFQGINTLLSTLREFP